MSVALPDRHAPPPGLAAPGLRVGAPAPLVTITVQITVPPETLPPAARRLVEDLSALADRVSVLAAVPPGGVPHPVRALPPHPSPRAGAGGQLRLVGGGGRPAATASALDVDLESRTVRRDGVAVHLSRREFDLLGHLCRYPRRVFSRAQLLRHVWEYEMVGGERTVDVHVRRLRAKLGRAADGIVTVRGVGYRFDEHPAVALTVRGGVTDR